MATWEDLMALLTPTVQTAINEIGEEAGTFDADFAVFRAAGDMVDSLRREKHELLEACRLLMKAEAMQQGERGGAIMGYISTAIDAARKALEAIPT